jgi:thioredoxin-like negative regulator of GroEL
MKSPLLAAAAPILLSLAACATSPGATSPPAVAPSSPLPAPPATAPVSRANVAPTPAAPALDQVLREAATTHKPVLLDFGATWCQPCADLAKTLALPETSRALGAYRFQAYDIDDNGEGAAAGERFGAQSLPLLVVLCPDGTEIDRVNGIDPTTVAPWLEGRGRIALGGPLNAQRLAKETDPLAFLLGARAAERATETDRARRLLEYARDADAKDARGIASEAAFDLLRFRARDADARQHGALLLEYAKAHPASPFAMEALEGIAALAASARPSSADLQRAAHAVRVATSAAPDGSLASIEFALGLSRTPPPSHGDGHPTLAPHDPLADAPTASEPAQQQIPPEIAAMFRRDGAIASKVGMTCKDAPRPAGVHQEWVRVWIQNGVVKRALLLDPEADPTLKSCIEREVGAEHDLPATYGEVYDWSIRFAAMPTSSSGTE